MLPALVVSHGVQTFPLTDASARFLLEGLAERLPERPCTIFVVSAYWETAGPSVTTNPVNNRIHGFHGFAQKLYEIQSPLPAPAGLPYGSPRCSKLPVRA